MSAEERYRDWDLRDEFKIIPEEDDVQQITTNLEEAVSFVRRNPGGTVIVNVMGNGDPTRLGTASACPAKTDLSARQLLRSLSTSAREDARSRGYMPIASSER